MKIQDYSTVLLTGSNYSTNNTNRLNIIKESFEHIDKVFISEEGYESWRKHLEDMEENPLKYSNNIANLKEKLGKVEMDVAGNYFSQMCKARAGVINELIESKGTYDLTDFTQSILNAYSKIYDQIIKGYAEGTREVWVSEEYVLTQEEDLEFLNQAYERSLKDVEAFIECYKTRNWADAEFGGGKLVCLKDGYQEKIRESMKAAKEEFEIKFNQYKNENEMFVSTNSIIINYLTSDDELWGNIQKLFYNVIPM